MQTVTSDDGTRIAYEQDGDGPPLVLVHGGSGTRESWDALRPHLVEEYTLVVPDRRGRGDSGDDDEYSLQREVDDLLAVVDAVDGTPAVFGHSFGGLVALAAASQTSLSELILYEPALLVDEHRDGADLAARMQTRLDDGDRRGAMALFFSEGSGLQAPERLPFWPDEVNFDLAETVVRENRALEQYRLDEGGDVSARTLLLTGENGPEHLRDAVWTLEETLSDSRVAELDGVGHVGIFSAPDLVADEVRQFLTE